MVVGVLVVVGARGCRLVDVYCFVDMIFVNIKYHGLVGGERGWWRKLGQPWFRDVRKGFPSSFLRGSYEKKTSQEISPMFVI